MAAAAYMVALFGRTVQTPGGPRTPRRGKNREARLMQDRPNPDELVCAVREFLRDELAPAVEDPRLRFRLQVAANALAIAERQMQQGESPLRAEAARLARLLDREIPACRSRAELQARAEALNRELARIIRAGERPPGTLDVLRQMAEEKLDVVHPDTNKRYV